MGIQEHATALELVGRWMMMKIMIMMIIITKHKIKKQ